MFEKVKKWHAHCYLNGEWLIVVYTMDINCNNEDLKTMSSLTQDDDHQISDVLFLIWECDKVDRRGAKGNKYLWYRGFCVNEYNIWNSTKALTNLTRSGGHSIDRRRGDILPKHQCQFKVPKENK